MRSKGVSGKRDWRVSRGVGGSDCSLSRVGVAAVVVVVVVGGGDAVDIALPLLSPVLALLAVYS